MAINYTTTFTEAGALIAPSLVMASWAGTTLPAQLKTIVATFGTAAQTFTTAQAAIQGIDSQGGSYYGFIQTVINNRTILDNYVRNVFTDPDQVLNQLPNLTATDFQTVMARIIQDMVDNSQTVKGNHCTIAAVTANALNVGTGAVLVDPILDGVDAPLTVSGSQPNINYNGVATQLCSLSETVTAMVVSDSYSGTGTVEGSEQFSLVGGQPYPTWDPHNLGNGNGPTVQVAHGYTLLSGLNFSNFTANVPNGFTLTAGAAPANCTSDTTGANVYRGTTSLKLIGDGATPAITLVQPFPSLSALTPRKRYCFPIRLKASSVPAAGTLTISLTGTGYTPTAPTNAQQTVTVAGAAGGNYTLTWNGQPSTTLQTTAAINATDLAAVVQSKLRALVGLESVTVTQAGGSPNFTNTIVFAKYPGNPPLLAVGTNSLTGGGTATVASTVTGVQGDEIVLLPAQLPTTWSLAWFYINLPANLPSNLALSISWSGTPSNAVNLWLDSGAFAPVVYFAGVNWTIVSGQTPWVLNDRDTCVLSNDQIGKFQTYLGQSGGLQLPYKLDASETISDALA